MTAQEHRRSSLLSSGYLWLFLAGLALRWVYLWQGLRNNELLTYPIVDARIYVDWAHDLMAGNWLWYEAKTYTPGMPVWLAGWFSALGERPWLHFAGFQLMGALQAVLLGKTAETLWNRKAGLATGWIAALYWPLILFEATYYAEPFASFTFTLVLSLLARWSRGHGGWRMLLGAGFALGWLVLVRSNTMLCAPVLALWVAVVVWQRENTRRFVHVAAAVLILAVPSICLTAPVVLWNWKVNGTPELRTGGWLSVHLGNNPEYRGLVVPVGVRWSDFVYQPIRADRIQRPEQNEYWREQVFRTMREQPAAWWSLQGRKAVMLTGNFEISQEIDIAAFRSASGVLSLPVWPGWWLVFPLASVAALAMARRGEARNGWALALVAAVYMFSVAPVQAASRYRLPVVVPMLPLAGWMLASVLARLRQREWGALFVPVTASAAIAAAVCMDWLHLGSEKIVNHAYHVGMRRATLGDRAGAAQAFKAGAEWNPNDPDCPYQLGHLALRSDAPAEAASYFQRSLELFPQGFEARIGLAECALALGTAEKALPELDAALKIAPNNREALMTAIKAYTALGRWMEVADACQKRRGYLKYPPSVSFTEVRALTLAKHPLECLPVLDEAARAPWFTAAERGKAAFLGSVLVWRTRRLGGASAATERWKQLGASPGGFFPLLGQMLAGEKSPEAVKSLLPAEAADEPHLRFALALHALQQKAVPDAVAHLEALLARRKARELPEGERELMEIWALELLGGGKSRGNP